MKFNKRLSVDISKMDNSTNDRMNIHSDNQSYTRKHPFHQKQNQKLQKFVLSPKEGSGGEKVKSVFQDSKKDIREKM